MVVVKCKLCVCGRHLDVDRDKWRAPGNHGSRRASGTQRPTPTHNWLYHQCPVSEIESGRPQGPPGPRKALRPAQCNLFASRFISTLSGDCVLVSLVTTYFKLALSNGWCLILARLPVE